MQPGLRSQITGALSFGGLPTRARQCFVIVLGVRDRDQDLVTGGVSSVMRKGDVCLVDIQVVRSLDAVTRPFAITIMATRRKCAKLAAGIVVLVRRRH